MPLGANKAAIMGVAGVSTADVVLLYDTDHSNVSAVAITSGITSTYTEYIFGFYNVNPATDGADFQFQVNASGESGYNETITSTWFQVYHGVTAGDTSLSYGATLDQAQGTGYNHIGNNLGYESDEHLVGKLHLFNPASTTYVKHFYARTAYSYFDSSSSGDYAFGSFPAGYINTTGAITGINFKMSTGNFDGTVKMWGVK